MENRNRNPNPPFEHQTGRQEEMREKINQSYNYHSGNQRVRMQNPSYIENGNGMYPPGNGYSRQHQIGNNTRRQPGMTNYYACQVIRVVFIVIFLIECYYCYIWLIQPVMPLITDVIEHNGVPSVGFSMPSDITHPLNGISVAGISGNNILSLWTETLIRAGIFGIVFPVTIKIRGFVLRFFS